MRTQPTAWSLIAEGLRKVVIAAGGVLFGVGIAFLLSAISISGSPVHPALQSPITNCAIAVPLLGFSSALAYFGEGESLASIMSYALFIAGGAFLSTALVHALNYIAPGAGEALVLTQLVGYVVFLVTVAASSLPTARHRMRENKKQRSLELNEPGTN